MRSDRYSDVQKANIAKCKARKNKRMKAKRRMNSHLRETGQKFSYKDSAYKG